MRLLQEALFDQPGIGHAHEAPTHAQLGRQRTLGRNSRAGRIDPALYPLLDDRYDRKSTLITSQLPVEKWHAYLEDPTIADAILDRLIHNSYRLALKGDSMRKQKTTASAVKTAKGH